MADQKLTLRIELENGQFVGNLKVSGKAVDRFTDRVRGAERGGERYNRVSPQARG